MNSHHGAQLLQSYSTLVDRLGMTMAFMLAIHSKQPFLNWEPSCKERLLES